jgi:hypothetical protein
MITASFEVVDTEGKIHSAFKMPFSNEVMMRAYLDSRSDHPFLIVRLIDFEEETNE